MNTGDILAGRPSLGAWTTYGLGTANENLPTFVVMADGAEPVGGPKNWSAGLGHPAKWSLVVEARAFVFMFPPRARP